MSIYSGCSWFTKDEDGDGYANWCDRWCGRNLTVLPKTRERLADRPHFTQSPRRGRHTFGASSAVRHRGQNFSTKSCLAVATRKKSSPIIVRCWAPITRFNRRPECSITQRFASGSGPQLGVGSASMLVRALRLRALGLVAVIFALCRRTGFGPSLGFEDVRREGTQFRHRRPRLRHRL